MSRKNFVAILGIVVMSLVVASSSFAATCGVMSIVSVASTDNGSGGQVWLRNDTTANCGSIQAGGQKLFNLPPTTSDKTMAVILTAMSLQKKLWVAFDDSTDPGVIQIVAMQN